VESIFTGADPIVSASEAVVAAALAIVAAVLWLVYRGIKSLPKGWGRTFLRAIADDIEKDDSDGRMRPKPASDGEAVVKAISGDVLEALGPKFDALQNEIEAVRTEQGEAAEREHERSRRVDRLELRVEGRLSRIEGKLQIEPAPDDMDAPTPR
jgi:hypothetical protein